jgi:hypothetical protein
VQALQQSGSPANRAEPGDGVGGASVQESVGQADARALHWPGMAAIVLLVYGLFLALQWPLAGHHLHGYIGFHERFVEPGETVSARHISNAYGYDGQFYYRLALDPLSSADRVHGIRFDAPALRQQRILLPALTWLAARGDPMLSAGVMLAINLLAVTACAVAGGSLLRDRGMSPWPALLLAFYPGFAISVERFLSEPLGAAMMLLGLLLLVRRRILAAGLVLALAVLARETALVVALAAALLWLVQAAFRTAGVWWRAPGPLFWGPALLTHLAWQTWLSGTWQATALAAATSDNLGWPLLGLAESLGKLVTQPGPMHFYFLFVLLMVLCWVLVAARSVRAWNEPWPWLWLAYLALAALLGRAIWDNSPGFLRITTELNLLGMVIYLLSRRAGRRWVFAAWAGCWLLTAGAEAWRLNLVDQARAGTGAAGSAMPTAAMAIAPARAPTATVGDQSML